MKLKNPLLQKTAGLVAAAVGVCLRRTIDWRAVYADPTTDPVHARHSDRSEKSRRTITAAVTAAGCARMKANWLYKDEDSATPPRRTGSG